ncbi:hypothetical protein T4B_7436 [Trichinella pseudospiralis]|uniref:Uncharacterized protein n=2 Tax=Trichinella pseudospiralis TaxID=6337 RepID=A0A0V1EV47_TRIPS|nr:hypothetical protein T4A_4764 [Trichinella pseudospiralis]KRY81345.1 hypothetical protein T4D_16095 [Trichinella pseudospiralis]KRZ32697.1 hypothetical protein T4B_7436 [Trichinella pseudospiralis]KRZ43935.1 hypothetical protein T4C_1142 [Trichinella pseudospiralis]
MQTELDARHQSIKTSVGQGSPKNDSISRHGNAARLDDAYGFSDSEEHGQRTVEEILHYRQD